MGKNVYLNGQILPAEKAMISVSDRGFLYGDALFETLRTYKKVPFMMKSHINRLIESANELGINSFDYDYYKKAVYSVIESNDISEGVVRITLTRGSSIQRSLYEDIENPNLLISINSLEQELIEKTKLGVKAISAEDKRSLISKHKNNSMLPSVLTYKQAQEKNAFDAILVTRRGFVTEGLRSNVFIVLDNILLTPPVSNRVLPGITRNIVINIARNNGLKFDEDGIVGQDLSAAEEIFLTNSLYEVIPVLSLNSEPVAGGRIGNITSTVQKGYSMLVENWLDKIFASQH